MPAPGPLLATFAFNEVIKLPITSLAGVYAKSSKPGMRGVRECLIFDAPRIDHEVGKRDAVVCVEEPGSGREIEQDVRARHDTQPSPAPLATVGSDNGPPTSPDFAARISGLSAAAKLTGGPLCPSVSRLRFQSLRATLRGSIPAAFHQPTSLPTRCSAR